MTFKALVVLLLLVFSCVMADLISRSDAALDTFHSQSHIDRRRNSQSNNNALNPYFIRFNDAGPRNVDFGPNLPIFTNPSTAWPPKMCEFYNHRHIIIGNKIYSAGLSDFGQLGNGTVQSGGAFQWPVTEVDLSYLPPGPHNWVQITCAPRFVIVRDDEDNLYGWGYNLGNLRAEVGDPYLDEIVPIPLPLNISDPFQNTSSLQPGERLAGIYCSDYICSILTTHNRVWSWGDNIDGLMGVGYASSREYAFLPGSYSMISCSQRVCSALDTNLGVVTWGTSGSCSLGDNNPNLHTVLQPTAISFPHVGRTVRKIISSSDLRAALLDNDDIYWWGRPLAACIPIPTLLQFPSRPLLSNGSLVPIVDVASFGTGLAILMANGNIYGAGSGLSDVVVYNNPTLLDLSNTFTNTTFFRYPFTALKASDNSIIALVEPRLRNETGCRPPAPSPSFVCVDNIWTTEDNPSTVVITIPSPTIIIGNLTVNGSITFNPDLANGNSSVPLLDVQGCAIITNGISIQIDQAAFDALSSSLSERTILLLVQNCPGLISNETETPQVRMIESNLKKSCKRVGVRRNQTIDEDTGKASLNAVLFIDDSNCNHNLWWIITVSVVCGVVVLAVIGFILLATFNSKVKQCVRPFTKRGKGQVKSDGYHPERVLKTADGHQKACKCRDCANMSSLVGQKV